MCIIRVENERDLTVTPCARPGGRRNQSSIQNIYHISALLDSRWLCYNLYSDGVSFALRYAYENDRNLTNSSPWQSFACSRSVGSPGFDDQCLRFRWGQTSKRVKLPEPQPLVIRNTHRNPAAQRNRNSGYLADLRAAQQTCFHRHSACCTPAGTG